MTAPPGAPLGPTADRPVELPPGALPPADQDGWRRLHKVTPVLKGWKVVAVALVMLGQQRGDDLITGGDAPGRIEILITVGALAVLAVAASVWAYLSWRMTRYRVGTDIVQLHSGVLFRQQRQARLDRLQAVDVVQPLLGRIFGLSELKLEVAGGAGSDVKLSYLRDSDAQRLRGVLLAQAAGVGFEGDEAPEAPEDELVQVSPGRLVGSLALSGGTIGAVLGLVALVVASFFQPAVLFGALPVVLGTVSAYWTQFTGGFGFRVAASPDGLRLRHGLLETRAQTVPPGRVQAVQLTQGLLWRRRDWWKVQVNVAGYGVGADGQDKETVLLPVATRAEAYRVLSVVLPDLGHPDPLRLLEAGLVGSSAATARSTTPGTSALPGGRGGSTRGPGGGTASPSPSGRCCCARAAGAGGWCWCRTSGPRASGSRRDRCSGASGWPASSPTARRARSPRGSTTSTPGRRRGCCTSRPSAPGRRGPAAGRSAGWSSSARQGADASRRPGQGPGPRPGGPAPGPRPAAASPGPLRPAVSPRCARPLTGRVPAAGPLPRRRPEALRAATAPSSTGSCARPRGRARSPAPARSASCRPRARAASRRPRR